jgi:phosphoribosylformylglycinamidine cyclo-ligase
LTEGKDEGMTDRRSGVDIMEEGDAIRALIGQLKFKRSGWGAEAGPQGHFTGLIDFGEWFLSLCTDGVGSKIKIAEEMRKYDTIGIDCMAMNVNDMICIGAEPLAFVDYVAMDRPDPRILREVGKGLNMGAEMANVSIIGGETASLPDMVKGLDLAGTCLGAVRKEQVVDSSRMVPGDIIIGLPSTGVHSNGYTLVRRIVADSGLRYDMTLEEIASSRAWKEAKGPGSDSSAFEEWASVSGRTTLGLALLEPTRIYVRGVLKMFERVPREDVKGLANITGGGLRNICRLRGDLGYVVDDPLPVLPVFSLLRALGRVRSEEMYQILNMGLGFTIVVSPGSADEALEALSIYGAKRIGKVSGTRGVIDKVHGVEYDGYV